MAVLGDLLFYRRDMVGLPDVLRHHAEQLQSVVDRLADKAFAKGTDADVAAQVARDQAIRGLSADFEGVKAAVVETEVDVRDPFGFQGDGPIRVPGLLATKTIPFQGDPKLWRLHPGSWNSNPPRGEVRNNTLVIGMSVPTQQADQAAQYIEQTLAQLPPILAQQQTLIDAHSALLESRAMPWIQARRQRQGAALDLLKKLSG